MTQPVYPPQPQYQSQPQPIQQPAQEIVFYQDASPVYISSSRAILLNQTFAIRNIVSVSMEKEKYYYISEGFYLLLGIALFFLGIRTPMTKLTLIFALVGSGFLLIVITLGFALLRKPYYAFLIGSAGGQVKTVTSKDPQYIATLVNALNAALAYRG